MSDFRDKPLHIAACSRDAAKTAVESWHYSQAMPSGRLACFGVWEFGRFVGVVLYGHGANRNIGMPYGVDRHEVCELVRVAMRAHKTAVSRIISITLKMMKKQMPKMRAVISYADTAQGHQGGIYRAGNWLYTGSAAQPGIIIFEREMHKKSVTEKYGSCVISELRRRVDPNARLASALVKHKFVMPLDAQMMRKLQSMSRTFPKRVTSIETDAATFQVAEGGETPTVTLHSPSRGTAEASYA